MTNKIQSLNSVLAKLETEGHIAPGWHNRLETALAELDDIQPWYVRVLIGFGAWLGSLLLISFVVGAKLLMTGTGGYMAAAILFIIVAVVTRRLVSNDFSNQAALAMSLSGQVLLALEFSNSIFGYGMKTFSTVVIVVNAILIPLFPDRTHRFLSVVFIVMACVFLIYDWKAQFIVPFLAPLLGGALVALVAHDETIAASERERWIRPIIAGLMVSAFGCVLLSTIYVLPELLRDFTFYPRPWISTVGCGLLLLYVEWRYLPSAFGGATSRAAIAAYGLTALAVVATLQAPGLMLSLTVLALGAARGDRVMTGAGLAFIAFFTVAYFYGIETTLLLKSATLVATGGVVLFGRWLLLRLLPDNRKTGHA